MTYRIAFAGLLLALWLLPNGATAQLNTPVKYIKGRLRSSGNGEPVDGGRLLVYQGTIVEPVTNSRINPATGEFNVLLDPSTEYRFEVVSPRFYRTDIRFTTPPEVDYEEIDTTFAIRPIPIGEKIYSGRLFEPGSSELREDEGLRNVISILKRQPNVAVTISIVPEAIAAAPVAAKKPARKPAKKKKKGNAPVVVDTVAVVPPVNYTELAQGRQNAVKNYMKTKGISTTRLTWDLKPGVEIPRTGGVLKPNVGVAITSIEPLDEDDE